MKGYIIIMICIFAIGVLSDIFCLGRGIYPRQRGPVEAWVDVFTMFLQMGLVAWGIYLFCQLRSIIGG